ncbi:MAG: PIN domain-containing protein [Chloroflexota bacterium]
MNSYVAELVQRYRRKGVLLDTNLLRLYCVGLSMPDQISRFKRTVMFTEDDFAVLTETLDRFEKIITTPAILAEVSNLAGQLAEHLKPTFFDRFAMQITRLVEIYTPSVELAALPQFKRFGLADTGILGLAKNNYLVITQDFRLSQYLQNAAIDVLNFNHIRM